MTKCKNGHTRTYENTYVRKSGTKECRVCKSETARLQRELAKESNITQPQTPGESNVQGFLALSDELRAQRKLQGSLATVGMAAGVNPISLGERERGLKNKLKAVARFADLLGLEVSFIVRKKSV